MQINQNYLDNDAMRTIDSYQSLNPPDKETKEKINNSVQELMRIALENKVGRFRLFSLFMKFNSLLFVSLPITIRNLRKI
jgi:hypothetical protein